MLDFNGQVVVVTGSGSPKGIGKTIAKTFARQGAQLIITDMNAQGVKDVVEEIQAEGGKAYGIVSNITDEKSVQDMVDEIVEKFGRLDVLVNNAGISENTSFMDYTEETFDKVMDLNVKGVFNTTRVAAECMVARGKGVILSTSSMVSISGQPSGFAYPASKFAVNGLTVSLARELGPKGIRVNAVAPGITETDMMKAVPKEVIGPMIERIPLRRLGQPEDIANAFVFLASDEASYITGVILSVDGMARS